LTLRFYNNGSIQERYVIRYKNVRPVPVMRRFIYSFYRHSDQEEPNVGPQHAEFVNNIATAYTSEETGDNNKRENDEHDNDKQYRSIQPIQKMKWLEQ